MRSEWHPDAQIAEVEDVRTIWHIVDPNTMLIVGRRFSRKSANEYVTRYNKAVGSTVLLVKRADISVKEGYRNATSRW